MKKAVIYVFSGTGNTRLVAGLYKNYLSEYETSVVDVNLAALNGLRRAAESGGTECSVPHPAEFDLIGFGYPVHGFNAPKIMVDFARLLPAAGGKDAFIFKTSGEGLSFNNYSSQKLIRILERKGFSFLCERHYVMPYNMIFRHTPEMVKSEYIYADAMVRLNVREIADGIRESVHTNPLKAWFVPIVRIEWLYAQLQGPAMRVDMKKCIRCNKCVRACPLENISFDGTKFRFGTNCALCVKCSFNCPTRAISIGLLNGWRVNGSYKIEETAANPDIAFPYFGGNLRGLKRWLYYDYYRRCDEKLSAAGIELRVPALPNASGGRTEPLGTESAAGVQEGGTC